MQQIAIAHGRTEGMGRPTVLLAAVDGYQVVKALSVRIQNKVFHISSVFSI